MQQQITIAQTLLQAIQLLGKLKYSVLFYIIYTKVTFLSWKHCDTYFISSRTATEACYSLSESVKK